MLIDAIVIIAVDAIVIIVTRTHAKLYIISDWMFNTVPCSKLSMGAILSVQNHSTSDSILLLNLL